MTRQLDALLQLAEAQQALGQTRNAHANLRAAQPLAESLDDLAHRAAVAGALGKRLWLTGAIDDARQQLERSVSLARQANAPQIAAASLNHLGNLLAEQGDSYAARAAYQYSLGLAQQMSDPALVATVQINAARLAAREQDRRAAETRLAEAARQVQTLPDSHDKAFDLLAIGQLHRALPGASATQRAQALQDFTAAADIARSLDDRRSLSYALGYQAQLQQDGGHPTEALALYRQAAFAKFGIFIHNPRTNPNALQLRSIAQPARHRQPQMAPLRRHPAAVGGGHGFRFPGTGTGGAA